jgi:hypothetical protein
MRPIRSPSWRDSENVPDPFLDAATGAVRGAIRSTSITTRYGL